MAVEDEMELDFDDDNLPSVPCMMDSPMKVKSQLTDAYSKNSFSVLSLNIRSIRKNFSSFLSFLTLLTFKFSVIILCETWLSDGTDFGFSIDGYKSVGVNRNIFGGGIKLYYSEMYNIEIIDAMTYVRDYIEVVSAILTYEKLKLFICAIYRPPSSSAHLFNITLFQDIIPNIPSDLSSIIVGDINFNLFNPRNDLNINEYINSLLAFNYCPLITRPTRINDNVNRVIPCSLVDHIWCNLRHGFSHMSAVVKTTITDHFPVLYAFKTNLTYAIKSIKFRMINEGNINSFVNNVNNECFDNIYEIDDTDDAFTYFYNKLFSIYNNSCPIKKRRLKHNNINNPWVTPKLKKCIKKKYLLYNLLRRGLIQKSYYNKYKNTLNWVSNKMRRLYFLKKFGNIESKKKSWNNINSFLNRKPSVKPIKIIDEFGNALVGRNLVENFNRYFTSIGNDIAASFPSYIDFNFLNNVPSVPHSCVFIPSSNDEIKYIIDGLKNKGNSFFDIKSNILKRISNVIAPILSYFYNRCFNDGVYPTVLKVARVVPIFKSGCHTSVNNYRPISNLSIINKIFEILTYNRMISFINYFNSISKFQQGFMKDSSTTLAAFRFVGESKIFYNRTFP